MLTGGLDYELTLSTGAMELEEVLIYKTSDNVSIFVRNCGVAAPGDSAIRIVPDIEAPTSGSYAWLNTTKLVGTRVVDGRQDHARRLRRIQGDRGGAQGPAQGSDRVSPTCRGTA